MAESNKSTGSFGIGAVLIAVIAAIFGIRMGGTGTPAQKETAAAAKDDDKPAPAPQWHPDPVRKSLHNFLTGKPIVHGLITEEKLGDQPRPESFAGLADRVNILIATVPDPIDTPFGFWFDQYVESLTRAAGNFGYIASGHWFPWEAHPGLRDRPESAKAGGDLLFLRHPGILLFREKE